VPNGQAKSGPTVELNQKNMNFPLLKRTVIIIFTINTTSCSLHLLGHSKSGQYMGMGQSTQSMSDNTFVPKKVQREEPLF